MVQESLVGGNIHNNEIWVITKIVNHFVIRDRNCAEHSVIFRKRKSRPPLICLRNHVEYFTTCSLKCSIEHNFWVPSNTTTFSVWCNTGKVRHHFNSQDSGDIGWVFRKSAATQVRRIKQIRNNIWVSTYLWADAKTLKLHCS